MVATFGEDGPPELIGADPLAPSETLERLLDDADRRAHLSAAGVDLARERSWTRAAEQIARGSGWL